MICNCIADESNTEYKSVVADPTLVDRNLALRPIELSWRRLPDRAALEEPVLVAGDSRIALWSTVNGVGFDDYRCWVRQLSVSETTIEFCGGRQLLLSDSTIVDTRDDNRQCRGRQSTVSSSTIDVLAETHMSVLRSWGLEDCSR